MAVRRCNIRNSPGGPLIRYRAIPLSVRKSDIWIVLMRSQVPGPRHGRWEPVARCGFIVCCPGRKEAEELCLYLGQRLYPPPPEIATAREGEHNHMDAYVRWLLGHHLRIDQYWKSGFGECWFSEFIRGWYPTEDEIWSLVTKGRIAPGDALVYARESACQQAKDSGAANGDLLVKPGSRRG